MNGFYRYGNALNLKMTSKRFRLFYFIPLFFFIKDMLFCNTITQTTFQDFSSGTYSGWGSSVSSVSGGEIRLGYYGNEISTYTNTAMLTSAADRLAVASWNGFLFAQGGVKNDLPSAGLTSAIVTQLSSTGGIVGTWISTSGLASPVYNHWFSIWNRNIYSRFTNVGSPVYYAYIYDDGRLGPWTSGAVMPGMKPDVLIAWNGHLYALGSTNNVGATLDTVLSGDINADGSISSFTAVNNMPAPRSQIGATVWNGKIYVVGGFDGVSNSSTVFSAQINDDGTIGSWTTEVNYLPSPRTKPLTIVNNSRIYVFSSNGNYMNLSTSVISAQIYSNGSIGPWVTEKYMPQPQNSLGQGNVLWNGNVLLCGGQYPDSSNSLSTVTVAVIASSSNYVDIGTYFSPVIDFGNVVRANSLSWTQSVSPVGSSVQFYIAAATSPSVSMSSWTSISNGGLFSKTGRYIQYKIVLNRGTSLTQTPVVDDVTINYSPDPTTWNVTNITDSDHGGADWIITADTQIAGNHTNIRLFKINSGVSVTVKTSTVNSSPWVDPYGVSIGSYGKVAVYASSVDIQGTLSADSAGFPSDGGIGSGSSLNGTGAGGGTSGAGGGYGGNGGQGNWNGIGSNPGNPSGGNAYGAISFTTDTRIGSGGGTGLANGAANHSGGVSGGAIYLKCDYINLNGTITANGGNGIDSTSGSTGTAGGGGSGGSISLDVSTINYLAGTVSAIGGTGGCTYGSTTPGGGGGGGRIKVNFFRSNVGFSAFKAVGGNSCLNTNSAGQTSLVYYVTSPGIVSYSVNSTSISVTLAPNGNPSDTLLSVTTGSFETSSSSAGTPNGGNITLTFVNLTPNTTYTVKARAVNWNQLISSSTIVGTTATLVNFVTIAGFNIYVTSVSVAINANGNPDGTQVVVSTGTNGHFAVANSSIGVIGGGQAVLILTGLSTNTFYGLEAGSMKLDGSTNTTVIAGSTWTLSVAPQVNGFVMYATSAAVTLGLNSNPQGTTLAITTGSFEVSTSSSGSITSLTITNLIANTTYQTNARAVNGNGSPTASIAIAGSTATMANVPGAINFNAVNQSSISIIWDNNSNPLSPQTSYQLQISTVGDFLSGTVSSSVTYALNGSTATLLQNTSYYFRVSAFHRWGGQSSYNTIVGSATLALSPGVVNITVNRSSISVTLAPNGNPTGTTLAVTTGSFETTSSSAGTSSGTSTTLTLLNLNPNSIYTVKASALNWNQISSTITVVGTTTTLASTPTIAGIQINLSSISVTLGANGNPSGTQIFISTGQGGNFNVSLSSIGKITGSQTTLTIQNLSTNTLYTLQAGVLDAYGSTQSIIVTASTSTLSFVPSLTGFNIFTTSLTVNLGLNTNPTGTALVISTGSFDSSSSSAGAVTSFSIGNLIPNTAYTLSAKSLNQNNIGSDPYVIATTATYANVPNSLSLTDISSRSITVQWSNNSNPLSSQTSYQVQIVKGQDFGGSPITTKETFNLSFTTSGLSADSIYSFRIAAFNRGGGQSAYSTTASTSTKAADVASVITPFQFNIVSTPAFTSISTVTLVTQIVGGVAPFTISGTVKNNSVLIQSISVNVATSGLTSLPVYLAQGTNIIEIKGLDSNSTLITLSFSLNLDANSYVIPSTGTVIQSSDGSFTIEVPDGLFTSPTKININTNPSTFNLSHVDETQSTLPGSMMIDINATTTQGIIIAGAPVFKKSQFASGKKVILTLAYKDPTEADDPLGDQNYKVFYFNDETKKWELAGTNQKIDPVRNQIQVSVSHFSLFTVLNAHGAAKSLSQMIVYPNPWKPNSGNLIYGKPYLSSDPESGVIFDKLSSGSIVKVYSLLGELIRSLGVSEGSGRVWWDGKNSGGEDVASGVYIYNVSDSAGNFVKGKLVVVR